MLFSSFIRRWINLEADPDEIVAAEESYLASEISEEFDSRLTNLTIVCHLSRLTRKNTVTVVGTGSIQYNTEYRKMLKNCPLNSCNAVINSDIYDPVLIQMAKAMAAYLST